MKALELAAYVVNKCVNDPSLSITNLQLQKIMYFLQIRSLKGNPCKPIVDDETFEAWKFGPVLTRVLRLPQISADAALKFLIYKTCSALCRLRSTL